MRKRMENRKLTVSGMFLALALLMPFLAGQIPQIGSMLCPMHIPVIVCGFFCGGTFGLGIGFLAPLLRSFLFGVPVLFPMAICMALELAAYGGVAGFFYQKLIGRKGRIAISLVSAMVIGRILWGIAMVCCLGTAEFGWAAFVSGAVLLAFPGIVLQLVLIPLFVLAMERHYGHYTANKKLQASVSENRLKE